MKWAETMVLTGNNAITTRHSWSLTKLKKMLFFSSTCLYGEWLCFQIWRERSLLENPMISKKSTMTLEAPTGCPSMIKPGVTASEVVLQHVMLKSWFGEWQPPPRLLSEWMCMNSLLSWKKWHGHWGRIAPVEPGIYIPEKLVFVSRTVVMLGNLRVFTHTPKKLLYFDV